ncbi:hypothetical protein ACHAWC_001693 [Mediolabrus comicus]
MPTSYTALFVTIGVLLVVTANAFSPSEMPTARKNAASTSYAQMKRVGFAAAPPPFHNRRVCNGGGVCKMATDAEIDAAKLKAQAQKLREEAAEAAGVSVEELSTAAKNADGTVYDDEPMLEPIRDPLSDQMRQRLMREASTGLDSNSKQTNVILYISAAVFEFRHEDCLNKSSSISPTFDEDELSVGQATGTSLELASCLFILPHRPALLLDE